MKTDKKVCIRAEIEAGSKEEYVSKVMELASALVHMMQEEERIDIAVALVSAAILQDAGAIEGVDFVGLCERCGVHVGAMAEADCKDAGMDAEEEN